MNYKNLHRNCTTSTLLTVLLLCSVGLTKSYAYDFSAVCETGQTLYYNITNAVYHYVELTYPGNNNWNGFDQPVGDIILPRYVYDADDNQFLVTSIGGNAFSDCYGLTSITIPNSVTYIMGSAFASCRGIEQIIVSTGNTVYDSRNNCNAIIKTSTNELVTGCKNTIIPNTVTAIGSYAFYGCSSLTGSLIIPNSVTTIGDYAFSGCSGLTGSLTIPNSVTTIGSSAFYGCSGFTGSLTIPNSVTTISYGAFSDCSGFTGSLTIPSFLTTIGPYAFYNCSGFTGSLTIPNSVTEIGSWAFGGCSGFTGSLTIPNSMTTIGNDAFAGCSGFTGSLTIPNSVTTIGHDAFHGCSGFTGSLIIPNSLTTIGDNVFNNCSGFTGSLTIPNSVTTIGFGAFSGCSGFTGSLTIPSFLTTIGPYAFYNCSGFTGSFTIPNSVTEIGSRAFFGCSGLTGSLTIPNSVTTIGGGAFSDCSGLTSLTIGNSVTTIGADAFLGCSGLTGSLTIPNSVTTIGGGAFFGCSSFTGSLTIPNSVTTIGNFAFCNCSGFTGSLTIPNSVTTIGSSAFYGCSGLTGSLIIPNSVTTIGVEAFYNCRGFTGSLTIPNSVTTIDFGAFRDCRGFTGSLTIPNSVTTIGDYAFYGCSGLNEIMMFEATPPSLGYYSFYITKNCPIYVPYESLIDYKTATNWSNYQNRIFPWLQKSISGYGTGNGGWYFIASPLLSSVAPTEINGMIQEQDYDLYRFNQSAEAEWENYKNPVHTQEFTINNGKGYLYASKEDVNVIFKGTFNEFDERMVSLAYDSNAGFAGWNLVGNPFPVNAYGNKSYYVMNEDGTAIEPVAVSMETAIPPCTGIMVRAEMTGQSVTFTKESRQVSNNNGTLQIAAAQTNTRSNAVQDKTIISFNEEDQLEKFVFNKDNAKLYIPQGNADYAIAYAEKQGEMPLNFEAKESGSYTISVNSESVEMNYMHLIDNMTGTDVDLLATPSYTFESKTSDYASRFRLVFSAGGDTNDENEEPFAFVSIGNIIVTGEYANATLQIVDMLGHVVVNTDVAHNVSTNGIASGVYVLQLINGNDVKTQKIVVR